MQEGAQKQQGEPRWADCYPTAHGLRDS